MSTVLIIAYAATLALIILAVAIELKRDLMMFQQNSYRPSRYRRWLSESKDSTSYRRLVGMILFFWGLSPFCGNWSFCIICGVFAASVIFSLWNKKYKKPLAWTARATRIYSVATVLSIGIAIAVALLLPHLSYAVEKLKAACETLLGCYCASHVVIMVANFLLKPVETSISRHYYNDAAKILKSMPSLKIVGITGSYGKTSTKHYLHRILSEQFDTLMTPGSFNTTLGVVRTIREYLKPYNEIFIVEMGAKNIGDVKEICDLVHPSVGIITAVGPQHLESFKTIENVQKAKFELVDSLPSDGLAIINNDFEKIADRPVDNVNCIHYGVANPEADLTASNLRYTSGGTYFKVSNRSGWSLDLFTRLMGEHNVSDLLAAIGCAKALGVSDTHIRSAVASIEPVEHRLSVKTTPGGITILDDAFNSNPVGSRMALEVLAKMEGGRRIVVTPGMIELGDEQYELNRRFGETIGRCADIAIVVGRYNRDAIIEGLDNCNGSIKKENIHTADSFAEAQNLLASIIAKGDIVLYENDLPDTFK